MLKIADTVMSRSESADRIEPRPPAARSSVGVVHCFVDPDELRRLLSIMAGTELVSEMIQSVLA